MSDLPNLVTTCTFKGREYLVKMNVINGNCLDLVVTDKYTAEDWNCSYDASYIENLTHKTGNFKQFEVFITMLKSGLLKTSECVSLDLLTFGDLELLRCRRTLSTPRPVNSSHLIPNSNRRYLILTYTVEFDRIHYPLPLEYCGPPDPQVLQAVIRRLETEVARLQEQLSRTTADPNFNSIEHTAKLEERIDQLTAENHTLMEEIKYLTKTFGKRTTGSRQVEVMQKTIRALEEGVVQDRSSFARLVSHLREEKVALSQQVEALRRTERGLRRSLAEAGRREATGHGEWRRSPARKPADGSSPQKGPKKQLGRTRTPSPQAKTIGGGGSSLPRTNLQNAKEDFLRHFNARKKPFVLQNSQSVEQFHPAEKVVQSRRPRSSSESSMASRRQTAAAIKLAAPVGGTINLLDRGRPRTRHEYRSSSATSSARTNLTGGRQSSASSTRSNNKTVRVRRKKKGGNQALKIGMSDLETRIQALQKLLRKGVGPMKE